MRAFAAMLALAVAAGNASASVLDLNPIADGSPAMRGAAVEIAGAALHEDSGSRNTLLALGRPIRHRRPKDGWGHRSGLPEYFATLGLGAFDPSNQPGSGLYLNGSVGSVLSDQLDLGFQISWYHRSTGGDEFVREGDLPDGTHVRTVVKAQSVRTDLVPVMATLRVRIPVSPGVEPYVGGGIGWEWLTVEGTDVSGFDFSNDYDGFGAQGIAGVNLSVGPQASLYGEGVWNASTPKAEFFDPVVSQTVREEVDFDGLAFHGGLRFRF